MNKQPTLFPLPDAKAGKFPALTSDQAAQLLAEYEAHEHEIWLQARKEYSGDDNIFLNFNRIAQRLDLTPERVLAVFAMKHVDGITSWMNGVTQQRDDILGRIQDLRIYLGILALMVMARRDGRTTNDPYGSVEPSSTIQDTWRASASREGIEGMRTLSTSEDTYQTTDDRTGLTIRGHVPIDEFYLDDRG